MKKRCIAAIALFVTLSQPAYARDQIRIAGSGTVYPFMAMAAEQFGQNGTFKTPIVEATGTGGGFKLFCEGAGEATPDLNDASRKMVDSETQLCLKNGVGAIVEIPLGFDGIVIAGNKNTPPLNLTKKQIFMALARQLPGKDGKMVGNPYQSWNEIDPALPDRPIRVYGPPPTSGTRDTFVELVMDRGCEQFPEFAKLYPDEKQRQKQCGVMREDGRYIEAGEDYNAVVQKLLSDDKALGIMGYGFYDENSDKVHAVHIEGIMPDVNSIESGEYSISRRLYIYVKKQHIGMVPGIVQFLHELTSENAVGPDGYLTVKGLLPLPDAERKAVRALVETLAVKEVSLPSP